MPAGVYLHIPFCKSRCSYCDFATDVYRNSDAVERYVAALRAEVNSEVRSQKSEAVDTIYFGGGTPSLLSPQQVGHILDVVYIHFDVEHDAEITMEMNPATVSRETLDGYRDLGVNRASFGVQTFDDTDLKLLARGHDANDARETFRLLRQAGFDNISFDLIAGLPGQSLQQWERNLSEAITMNPEHISLYLLEIHEGTPLAEQVRSGRRPIPDEQLAAEMYELMLARLSAAAYEQYEISNFAKPGFESRHNSKYWRMEPVFGFGVSAHSFDGKARYANERDTAKYVELMETSGSAENFRETVDLISETAFLGLRMTGGIDVTDIEKRFGVDFNQKYSAELNELIENGLVETMNNHLKLTPKGMLYSNEVFRVFV
ncbi:MAG TPA: radical SAM family heme chaperone HemW [Pyrinomonadaceae bacterium]|nr:radical SAM family heme chaperone HemW [Pyrinomonadaceae bacterium]